MFKPNLWSSNVSISFLRWRKRKPKPPKKNETESNATDTNSTSGNSTTEAGISDSYTPNGDASEVDADSSKESEEEEKGGTVGETDNKAEDEL